MYSPVMCANYIKASIYYPQLFLSFDIWTGYLRYNLHKIMDFGYNYVLLQALLPNACYICSYKKYTH